MISVIIPNFNRSHYLKEALTSVLHQSHEDWEVLVVDDGSSDDSKTLVSNFSEKDKRFIWLERKGNLKGASVCRNLGIENAKGDYIIFLDSDDVLAPHCLQQRMEVMKAHPNVDFTVFKMQFFVKRIGDDQRIWNLENNENNLQRFLNLDTVWQTSGPIWKTKALKSIGGFDPKLKCWQDIDIHVEALLSGLNYKVCYDLPVDCYYRKDSEDSISQSNINSIEKLKSKTRLLRRLTAKTNTSAFHTDQMAVRILLSAIHGYKFRFYRQLLKEVKHQLPKAYQKKLNTMAGILFFRLNRWRTFQDYFLKLKQSIVIKSFIGKLTIHDA